MPRLFKWIGVLFLLIWGALSVIGNLDEAQNIILRQSDTVRAAIALAKLSPWWVPTALLAMLLVVQVCLEFDLLPRKRAELIPFLTQMDRVSGGNLLARIGIQNSSEIKAVDTQITMIFWRCSMKRRPVMHRRSVANPISSNVRQLLEIEFQMTPVEPMFVIVSFAYRSSDRGRLKTQSPSFYYKWDGSDSELTHASKEEREMISKRLQSIEPTDLVVHDASVHAPGSAGMAEPQSSAVPPKRHVLMVIDQLDDLIRQGEELIKRFRDGTTPQPTKAAVQRFSEDLMRVVETCATGEERENIRTGVLASEAERVVYCYGTGENQRLCTEILGKCNAARAIVRRIRTKD